MRDLVFAERLHSRPPFIPTPRKLTATQSAGLGFERAVLRALPFGAVHNPWFRYIDRNGEAYCSPDIVLTTRHHAVIFECKLSRLCEAKSQLLRLYCPVISRALLRTPIPIIVTRHLTRLRPHHIVTGSLLDAIRLATSRRDCVPVLHYIGKGKLS